MTLDDFEKTLAEEKKTSDEAEVSKVKSKTSRRHHHHHHSRHHHRDHHGKNDDDEHRPKRSKHSHEYPEVSIPQPDKVNLDAHIDEEEDEWVEKAPPAGNHNGLSERNIPKRDTWMEEPNSLEVDYVQRSRKDISEPSRLKSSKPGFELKIHENELNKHHLQNLAESRDIPDDVAEQPAQHAVDYIFGDSGAQWRMTKLKAVHRRAGETGRNTEDVAIEQYGDLRAFDDAREEEIELERRVTYGKGYVGKDKPSGELFQERKLEMGVMRSKDSANDVTSEYEAQAPEEITEVVSEVTPKLDQTALNGLKAQMMKAKLRGSPDAGMLEAKYNEALTSSATSLDAQTVVLGPMDTRVLATGRRGEVKPVDNKRGRERGLVEENEDMSIEDMVREVRQNRNQAGGDGQRFAERIAKDAKFDNDLDYMDENAAKLAKRVQKSEISLKSTAISDFQKMNRMLDNCPLCHHEDSGTPPIAPIVSLGTRVFLTLPTEPEISDGGACIIPIQHRGNLLECDDDEWEEIRNFMKSLLRMYHDQGRDVIFYENAATPQRKKHAGMEVVPLPYSLGETAPAFFKEAILTSDEEWTQHKKIIDTLAKAKQGLGKLAFRRTLVKEMPYFHVWFEMDGGLGHVVEDANRWPKGDLFAREIIGGMLDKDPSIIKRQGKWHRGEDRRVEIFRKRWRKFDWTRVLTDS
ncbi:MAG: hypothetical protein Q9220_003469 [cf. Caloplaca sp. 1 TL-2023]